MPRTKRPEVRRRTRGEGTLYEKTRTWKTSDGKTHSKKMWVAAVSEGFEAQHGRQRRRRRFFYGGTAAEARGARDRYLSQAGKDIPKADAASITVSEYMQRFLAHLDEEIAARRCSPTTRISYEQVLRLYVEPELGRVPFSGLSTDRVQHFYDALKLKVSPSRVARVHTVLRVMLNLAREERIIAASPLDGIPRKKRPRYRSPQVESLTERQAQALLQAAKGHRLEALVVLALTTGMRQGELMALRWSDVDLRRRTLSVSRSAQEVEGIVTFVEPKSERSRRRITLSAFAVSALKDRQALARREPASAQNLVFPDEHGRPLLKDHFSRWDWDPIRKAAGLPDLNFHGLRHTAASLLLVEGIHPKIVSEMLGHSSIKLTLDTYSHLLPSMGAAAADAFDRVFSPRGKPQKGT